MKTPSLWSLLRKVHQDEKGAVSLETILVVALIALPILIFLYNVGWPRIKNYFLGSLDQLEEGQEDFVNE
ncbi:MAG: hypothetical protein VB875_09290 [Pirellulales bacterium]